MTTPCKTLLIALFLLTSTGVALAGNLDPPAGPTDPASAMFTVNDLHNRLTTGAAGVKRSGPFMEPAAAPAPTGYTTDQLMAVMPAADNTNGATAAEVVGGKSFWGLRTDGTWGQKVGAMPILTLNPTSTAVPTGYYNATNLATVDPDLAAANIRGGVAIFGVNGKPEVVDTTEAVSPASAGQMLAGRKAFVNGAAVTGTITAGVNVAGPNGSLTVTVPDGMYIGSKTATASDTNLVSGNVRSGVTIFGVAGNPNVVNTGSGTATATDIMAGKKAWGAGTEITGTLPTQTLNPASTTVPAGYYAATNLATVDPDLAIANIRAGVNLFGVNGKSEVVDTTEATNPAVAGTILTGKKAFVNGAAVTGTVPVGANVSGGNGLMTFVIPDGLYSGSKTATANDTNLVAGNIRAGVSVFGVTGDPNVVNTGSATATSSDVMIGKKAWGKGLEITGSRYPIPVGKTGQVTCFDAVGTPISCGGTGQDGDWQQGIAPPSPRFTDNTNGTVTDNATGLIWLKNANCFSALNWQSALDAVNGLAHGGCNLSDGSTAGQWRLPNLRELMSLVDWERAMPALPLNYPFINVIYDAGDMSPYWSATTSASATSTAWYVKWNYGYSLTHTKHGYCASSAKFVMA